MLKINSDELNTDGRFSRFELISWWDQKRLEQAKILVIGAGALGNELIKNCALTGIGNVVVADMDRIENSNLSRSVLYRETDNGEFKANVAARAGKEIYPQLNIQPFNGNVVHDLGLGVYMWADVILGGLDNREARVAINSGAAFARKPWIDGAIEVLNGVARVFEPYTGSCYECTMSQTDWKMLENRRSCALLTRSEMEQGKIPTTPTTASIIAAVQVQEAIKILHGMDHMSGEGLTFTGLMCEAYKVKYPRKEECYGHETYEELETLGKGAADITVGEIVGYARERLGKGAVVGLSRDIITALVCPACGESENIYASLGKVTENQAYCPKCNQMRTPDTLLTLGLDDSLNKLKLSEIGVPYFDILTARSNAGSVSLLLDGDAEKILGKLH